VVLWDHDLGVYENPAPITVSAQVEKLKQLREARA
jgi:hypothetical protein